MWSLSKGFPYVLTEAFYAIKLNLLLCCLMFSFCPLCLKITSHRDFWRIRDVFHAASRGINRLWHIRQIQGSRSGVSGVLLTNEGGRSRALCNLIILNVWTWVWVMSWGSGSCWWQQYMFQISTCICSKASELEESNTLEFSLLMENYIAFPLFQLEMFW